MPRKVVIVDDEPWTRKVILELGEWRPLNLEVVGEAADGEAGLELIHKLLPDIVITDVKMPRINGIELLQKLRSGNYNIPVIFVSGYDDYTYVRNALKLGATDYLLKPIKAQELNKQLHQCVKSLEGQEISKPAISAGFFANGWEDVYNSIKKQLEIAVKVKSSNMVSYQFEKLETIICEHEGEKPSINMMIGVYYSMLYPLQVHIESIGLSKNTAFGESEPIFVFSHGNTIKEMLDYLKELYINAINAIEEHQQNRERLNIDDVCKYVQQNFTRGITLEETADAFHVSKEYLSKAFKLIKKEGFTEYITSLRMQRAHNLITQYNVQIKEVCEMVGYVDLAHFYKVFKKHFGETPGEIRDGLKIDKTTTP